MFIEEMSGVSFVPLNIIESSDGAVMHALKASADQFVGFGEAYFSTVYRGKIKGWKKHRKMTLNLIVPHGTVQFMVYDDRPNSKTHGNFFPKVISKSSFGRLTIEPNLWVAFKGLEESASIILNVANIEHQVDEADVLPINELKCIWEKH